MRKAKGCRPPRSTWFCLPYTTCIIHASLCFGCGGSLPATCAGLVGCAARWRTQASASEGAKHWPVTATLTASCIVIACLVVIQTQTSSNPAAWGLPVCHAARWLAEKRRSAHDRWLSRSWEDYASQGEQTMLLEPVSLVLLNWFLDSQCCCDGKESVTPFV